MKKRYLSLLFIPLLAISCTKEAEIVFYPYINEMSPQNVKNDIETDNYYKFSNYKTMSYVDMEGETKEISSYRDLYSSDNLHNKFLNEASLGKQKLLVIPVYFKGENSERDIASRKEKTIMIQNAFFGDPDKTGFESVSSFYNKSSYGHLSLTGEVTDWYEMEYSRYDDLTGYGQITKTVASNALDWLRSEEYKGKTINLEEYDNDNDDYIDGIYLIYDAPYDKRHSDSIYWAFTSHTKQGEYGINNTAPYACTYSWSSVDFAYEKENTAYRNTYIHEVGHIFGLSDYYSSYMFQPTGSFDTMDSNLGDHCGFSKMILNWVTPYVIRNSCSITLKSFTKSGDLVLIPLGNYNGTPYDEYLLLEYFTPVGLNEVENASYEYSKTDGTKGIFTYPSYHGLRVYHIDARAAYLTKKIVNGGVNNVISYIEDPKAQEKLEGITSYCVGLAHGNENAKNASSEVLVHLLEKDGNNSFASGNAASNKTLFRLNDSFGLDTFNTFTSNKTDENGNHYSLGFTFKITSLHSDKIEISFSKVA